MYREVVPCPLRYQVQHTSVLALRLQPKVYVVFSHILDKYFSMWNRFRLNYVAVVLTRASNKISKSIKINGYMALATRHTSLRRAGI